MKGPCPDEKNQHALCGWCDDASQCEQNKARPASSARSVDLLHREEREALMRAHGAWLEWKLEPRSVPKASALLLKTDAFFAPLTKNLTTEDDEARGRTT